MRGGGLAGLTSSFAEICGHLLIYRMMGNGCLMFGNGNVWFIKAVFDS